MLTRMLRSFTVLPSNENKMSDGGRERASLEVEMWKSSQKWSVQRSAVRSIAWLDAFNAVITSIRWQAYRDGYAIAYRIILLWRIDYAELSSIETEVRRPCVGTVRWSLDNDRFVSVYWGPRL